MEHIHYVYWLSCVKGIGSVKRDKLLKYFGSEEEIFSASREMLLKVISAKDIESLVSCRNKDAIEESYGIITSKGIKFTYNGHDTYPEKLYGIYDAPYCLFYKGMLPDGNKKSVAVVGARDVSYSGSKIAWNMGRGLAENGVQVISGLAKGVDISAQKGALSIAGNKTFAVMGCGIDICYPRQHIEAYMLIQEGGGIISEYPLGVPPMAYNFPARNRIISALSDGILVIEAGEKSGSLITAEYGVNQGKDIFAIPGEIGNKLYRGSNRLIKEGAALVTDISDIMDALGVFYDCSISEHKQKFKLETDEKIVYASLGLEPAYVSEIAVRSGFSIKRTIEILIDLELKQCVCMVGNNYYALKI